MDGPTFRSPAAPEDAAVYWITGLPGVGRKTLARSLAARLSATGAATVRLDGDRVRQILGDRFGYGLADRRHLALAYGRLCAELASQDVNIVFSTVSMFHEARRWNRANIASYREIYLRASPQLLAERHSKGLYAAALAGRIRQVVGVDLPMEEPETPDVVIDITRQDTSQAIAREVFDRLRLWSDRRAGVTPEEGAALA